MADSQLKRDLGNGRTIFEVVGQGRGGREIMYEVRDASGKVLETYRLFNPLDSDKAVLTSGGAQENNVVQPNTVDPATLQTIRQWQQHRIQQFNSANLTEAEKFALQVKRGDLSETDWREQARKNLGITTNDQDMGPVENESVDREIARIKAEASKNYETASKKLGGTGAGQDLEAYATSYANPYRNTKSSLAEAWGGGKGPLAIFTLAALTGGVASSATAPGAAVAGAGGSGAVVSAAPAYSAGVPVAGSAMGASATAVPAVAAGAASGALESAAGSAAGTAAAEAAAGKAGESVVDSVLNGAADGLDWFMDQTKDWGAGDWLRLVSGGLGAWQMIDSINKSDDMMDLTKQSLDQANQINQERLDLAKDEYQRYLDVYGPAEERLAARLENPEQYAVGAADARVQSLADMAGNDVNARYDALQQASDMRLRGLGADPRSGRYEGTRRAGDISNAANYVEAVQKARRNAIEYYDNMDWGREADFVKTGRNIPNSVMANFGNAAGTQGQIAGGYGDMSNVWSNDAAGWGQFTGSMWGGINPQSNNPENLVPKFADGGIVGRYIDGPGTGRSDSVHAVIDDTQPAKLSAGEFVVPKDVVDAYGPQFFETLISNSRGAR